jgi:hypothetical protein
MILFLIDASIYYHYVLTEYDMLVNQYRTSYKASQPEATTGTTGTVLIVGCIYSIYSKALSKKKKKRKIDKAAVPKESKKMTNGKNNPPDRRVEIKFSLSLRECDSLAN